MPLAEIKKICTVNIFEVSCQWSVDEFDFWTPLKKVTVEYFEKISRISVREFNWEVVVTSGFDPSWRYNAVIQNRFAQFNFQCITYRFYLGTWLLMDEMGSSREKNTNHPIL